MPRRRRRTVRSARSARSTRSAARLGAVVAANLIALALLARLLAGGGGAAETRTEAAELASLAAPVAAEPRASVAAEPGRRAPLDAARWRELERRVRAVVATHVERAREASRGRVHAGNAQVAVHARELDAGAGAGELALGSDAPLRPASNAKLVTSAAALVLLGADWSFQTRFCPDGPLEAGHLRGHLVVRAGGDPLYERALRGAVEPLLEPALDALLAAGLRVVEGDLVLDEGSFQAPAPAPGWPDASQHWAEYCALAGGLSANRGCLTALVRPARPGAPAQVELLPRGHGLAETFAVETSSGGPLRIALLARGEVASVRGTLPAGVPEWSESFAHPDPVALFGSVLRAALARRGIEVRGALRRERGAAGGAPLATLRTPLLATLGPINTDSTNAVADQLFLAMGRALGGAGTREAGAAATRAALERLGVPTAGFEQADGSGLSRDNRVSARQVAALLEAVLALPEPAPELYRASLAIAGETGTLAGRMGADGLRGRVHAKTGFIAGTSALSGVAVTAGGRRLVFSILVNYPDAGGLNTSCWKPMQDAICALLVEVEG